MGSGRLLRDDKAEWLVGFSTYEGVGDILVVEHTAMKHGLMLAWDEGFRPVLCESDSRDVVTLLSDNKCNGYHMCIYSL